MGTSIKTLPLKKKKNQQPKVRWKENSEKKKGAERTPKQNTWGQSAGYLGKKPCVPFLEWGQEFSRKEKSKQPGYVGKKTPETPPSGKSVR